MCIYYIGPDTSDNFPFDNDAFGASTAMVTVHHWPEIDPVYYVILLFKTLGIVQINKPAPEIVMAAHELEPAKRLEEEAVEV